MRNGRLRLYDAASPFMASAPAEAPQNTPPARRAEKPRGGAAPSTPAKGKKVKNQKDKGHGRYHFPQACRSLEPRPRRKTAVLSYALAHPGLRAVIDDADARRCAKTLGIPMLGTGGVLVLAKRRSLIPSVTDALRALR